MANTREQILSLVKQFYNEEHSAQSNFKEKKKVLYAGRVFDEKELVSLVDASLDFWLTAGKYAEQFERDFAKYLNVPYCSLVNSGSSANLVAFMALTSLKLGERRVKKEDEVITVAAGFPTTVNPIIQYGAIPVFIDVTLPNYNVDIKSLENALSDKTKAVMIAHTLGNPFDLTTVKDFCEKNNLWLVEDNCDALGSEYLYKEEWRKTGTIGDIGTSSFYPPHHMTMGEGGAVYTSNMELKRIIDSFRDWGRDCWCPPGKDDTCRHRFTQQFGELPKGYDHKYVYSHFGYNLKATDMQAAIGIEQLKKLDSFIEKRRTNWNNLKKRLSTSFVTEKLILPEPEKDSKPSWFGFLITVKENAGFSRNELVEYLEINGIQTRNLFAGNFLRHPCFDEMRKTKDGYRVIGNLENSDLIMNNSFWVGVYPGMTDEMLNYMADNIIKFVEMGR